VGCWQCAMENMVVKEIIEYFSGKSVLITGHTGFKGSWMTYLLWKYGAKVTGYALYPNTHPSLFNDLCLNEKCNSIIGDINDFEALKNVVNQTQPDFIFHMAAQPLVRYSYKKPIETFSTNVMGTANLLEACRQLKKKCCVVCVTTDKVYANNEWEFPYREIDRLGGHDPYSASKAASELVIDSYRKSYFSDSNIFVASARAGNVIGGGDWSEDRLIPDIIRSISANEPIVLRNPNAVRPWQHVLDPIFGYLLLGMNLFENGKEFADSWNFGPKSSESMTVMEVCKIMVQTLGKGKVEIDIVTNKPHEAGLLTLDISKVKQRLGWEPNWSSETAINRTAEWYMGNLQLKEANKLVEQDIQSFLSYESN